MTREVWAVRMEEALAGARSGLGASADLQFYPAWRWQLEAWLMPALLVPTLLEDLVAAVARVGGVSPLGSPLTFDELPVADMLVGGLGRPPLSDEQIARFALSPEALRRFHEDLLSSDAPGEIWEAVWSVHDFPEPTEAERREIGTFLLLKELSRMDSGNGASEAVLVDAPGRPLGSPPSESIRRSWARPAWIAFAASVLLTAGGLTAVSLTRPARVPEVAAVAQFRNTARGPADPVTLVLTAEPASGPGYATVIAVSPTASDPDVLPTPTQPEIRLDPKDPAPAASIPLPTATSRVLIVVSPLPVSETVFRTLYNNGVPIRQFAEQDMAELRRLVEAGLRSHGFTSFSVRDVTVPFNK